MAWGPGPTKLLRKISMYYSSFKVFGFIQDHCKIDRDNSLLGKVAAGGKFKGNN